MVPAHSPPLGPPSPAFIRKIRCPCSNTLGAWELIDGAVQIVVRIGRGGGQKRAIIGPLAIVCELCGTVWKPRIVVTNAQLGSVIQEGPEH